MLTFKAEQKNFQIGNVKIGGQPGEYPTVLIGSIFYSKHNIVRDVFKGEFDRRAAEDLLNKDGELSEEYGIPRIIDVMGETSEALCKYIDFVADYTDSPFLIDSSRASARVEALKHVEEIGLVNRAIYNSIDEHIKEDEISALQSSKIKSAVILAFSTQYLKPKDRLKMLEGDGKNLIKIAKDVGIENILIDPGVLDMPSVGWTADIIYRVKQELGYPAGCAPSNALYMWLRRKRVGSPQFEACGASVLALLKTMGSDFIIYGPMKHAKWIYPACAATDAIITYEARNLGITPKAKINSLSKGIFSYR